MLEFTKQLLTKVSFDKKLFQKELRKSLKFLKRHEAKALYVWCLVTFGDQYKDIIIRVFDESMLF